MNATHLKEAHIRTRLEMITFLRRNADFEQVNVRILFHAEGAEIFAESAEVFPRMGAVMGRRRETESGRKGNEQCAIRNEK
ncbi:hypothetical protein JCM18694_18070 [Prolixibacter denitrificans]|uniref:Uncharacterized protein n=1 Tax=Prolixibacter denitrificans TaxID=1541063 RepID=A0ABQ0ZJD7_9BACT|nr:hypothetical protein JCM18694_18070 [Prolixibacter denitrificans]